jgi:hypothetical protein
MAKTKGFRPRADGRGTVTISFGAEHRLHGLVIVLERRVPVGVVLAGWSLAVSIPAIVKRMVSWTLVDEKDEPVPPSIEAFGEYFDVDEARDIVTAWIEVTTNPSTPLGQP